MLVLSNVTIEPSNVRKNKGTTECDKKIKVPPNVRKVQPNVILVLSNVTMESSNVRKNKGTTECDKVTVTCDVGTVQCEDDIVKYDILVTWYSRLPISGYNTHKIKRGGGRDGIITLF